MIFAVRVGCANSSCPQASHFRLDIACLEGYSRLGHFEFRVAVGAHPFVQQQSDSHSAEAFQQGKSPLFLFDQSKAEHLRKHQDFPVDIADAVDCFADFQCLPQIGAVQAIGNIGEINGAQKTIYGHALSLNR